MKHYDCMNCKIGRPAFWVFLFAMLLLARDTLITSVVLGFTRSQLLMLAGIAAVGLGFLWANRRHWKEILTDRRMILMGVSAVLLLLPMLGKRDWQMMYFSILVCLLLAVFLTYFRRLDQVAKIYVCLITGLGLYSLITMYLLKAPAEAGILPVSVVYNSNDWPFYNFGLSFVVTWEAWNRNFGVFREPGVYQYFILLGVYLNNYHVDWKAGWQLWLVNGILAVTMLSTFAIGGFLELGLFAVFLYWDKKYYKTRGGKLAGGAAVVLAAAAVGFVLWKLRQPDFELTPYYEFYDMFIRLFTKSESSSDRFGSILANLRFLGGNPLLGGRIADVLYAIANNTSSTMILYAILGILGGSWNVLAWMALLWKKERHFLMNLVLMGILFLSFNTQNLIADVFFWLFPMMALTERILIFERKKV